MKFFTEKKNKIKNFRNLTAKFLLFVCTAFLSIFSVKVVSLQAPWFPLIIQTTVVNVSGHLSSEGPSSVQSDFFQSASVDIEPSGISIHVRFCQNSHQFCTEVHTYTTLNHTAFYELVSLNVSHVVFFSHSLNLYITTMQ